MANWLDQGYRKSVVDEIESNENITRKRFEQRKFDVYRNRQDRYVIERLEEELKPDFVSRMRKVLSINPCKRIVDEMASLYKDEPDRSFSDASEKEKEQIEELYHYGMVDAKMRLANAYYKLHDQCALFIAPREGVIDVRVLSPKDYDVIPDSVNPEKAQSYILSVWDLDQNASYRTVPDEQYRSNDQLNQTIADDSDRKQNKSYVVWDKEFHFTMNSNGDITSELVNNPIGILPFIDIAMEKDFQFFVRRGSGTVEFTIDLLTQLSDLASISRMQGYSQAIISSDQEPKPMVVGPDRIIWLKKDPNNPQSNPTFEFVSPSPDLSGSLEIIDSQVKMFLSSQGIDASVVSGKGEKRTFASGVDHLLANIDKFQASQQDMSLFRWVEYQLFEILRLWSNAYQNVTLNGLIDELRIATISDNVEMSIQFASPHSVRTQSETEDSVIKLMESGLMSREQGIMRLYEVDESKAEEIISDIDGQDPLKQIGETSDVQDAVDSADVPIKAGDLATNLGGQKASDAALNGAQVQALVDLVARVAAGEIPRDSAVNIAMVGFLLDKAQAESIISTAGTTFKVAVNEVPQGNEVAN